LYAYQQGIDPNIITFNLSVTNQYINTTNVPMQITVTAGIPKKGSTHSLVHFA
jgi:hypothetical protein